jgi:uncharacterized protein (DUF2141 family)
MFALRLVMPRMTSALETRGANWRMPRLRVLSLSTVLLALFLAGLARAATIIVTLDRVRSDEGDVYVTLYSRPQGFPGAGSFDRHAKVKAHKGSFTVMFDHVAPGTYAVGAYHDENANGQLDMDFLGYPVEGYALSNGVRAATSRPRFADAAFPVGDGDNV